MAKVLKFWAGLGVAAVSNVMTADAGRIKYSSVPVKSHLLQTIAASGEAGESGVAPAAEDQPQFIADLALVEGHMRAGVALYKEGRGDAALVHMKHPADELYAVLKPMLESRKTIGFADELEALSMAMQNKVAPAEVDQLFDKMKMAIVKARGGGEAVSAHAMTGAVLILLRSAVADYAKGVDGGMVKVPKEYQDAWGFVQAAKAIMADLSKAEREEHSGPLAELDGLWPDLAGEKQITVDAHLLAVAAAKVELAGLDIK
jgi:hypothetical protein